MGKVMGSVRVASPRLLLPIRCLPGMLAPTRRRYKVRQGLRLVSSEAVPEEVRSTGRVGQAAQLRFDIRAHAMLDARHVVFTVHESWMWNKLLMNAADRTCIASLADLRFFKATCVCVSYLVSVRCPCFSHRPLVHSMACILSFFL